MSPTLFFMAKVELGEMLWTKSQLYIEQEKIFVFTFIFMPGGYAED